MTASWSGGPPVDAASPGPTTFVVSTVRSAVLRRFRFVIGIQVGCALLVMALLLGLVQITDGVLGALGLLPILILLLGVGFQIGVWCYEFGARSAIRVPLVLTPDGPVFSLAQGTLTVPWAAVAQLTLRSVLAGQVLRFHLHPAVTVDSPGVRTDLSPQHLGWQMRRGLAIGSVGIDRDISQVTFVAEQLARRPLLPR